MVKLIALFTCIFSVLVTQGQLITDSVLVDNHYRTFHFKKPSINSQGSLIFILHGSGGNGKGTMSGAAKLDKIANTENLLLVYPDGYKNYWNECRKMSFAVANKENVDENTFFSKMIDYFIDRYKIDSKKVFAIGTSGGGHMAYKLAITMPERFTAITAIIANLPDSSNMDCTESKIPIPVMIINGTADNTNPYLGGEVILGSVSMGRVRSTDQSFKYWADLDGYKGKPKHENLPDTDPLDGKTVEKFTYKKKGKPEVVLLKVNNGKHDYPNDVDVYLEAWEFFKRQQKRG